MAERYKDFEIIVMEPEKVIDILEQEITKEDYDLDYIKDLVTYGAFDIDSVLSDGKTLIIKAKHKWDIVSVLLESGADPNAQDSYGMTAIKRAVLGDSESSFREILKHHLTNPNIQDSERWTALMNGTFGNRIRMVRELLKHPETNPNLQNISGNTALMMASSNDKTQVVKELLNHPNIDPNLQEWGGETALMLASLRGYLQVVQALLSHPKTDPNLQADYYGSTALVMASENGHSQVVQVLLSHPSTNTTIKNKDGQTAWDVANPEIRKQFPELNPIEYIIKAKDKEIEELKSLIEELKSKSKKSKKVS